jgi:hypothetical protein
MATLTGSRVSWVTSSSPWLDHAVADDDFTNGRSNGMFTALCGARFLPASMCTESGPCCTGCRVALGARTPVLTVVVPPGVTQHRRHAAPGRLTRLLSLCTSNVSTIPSPRSAVSPTTPRDVIDR